MTNNNIGNKEMTIEEFIELQKKNRKSSRKGNFTDFTSKKKLFASGILTEEQEAMIGEVKGTFNFSKHDHLEYLIITLYNKKAEKKYTFFVVNLDDMSIVQKESIKKSKEYVDDIYYRQLDDGTLNIESDDGSEKNAEVFTEDETTNDETTNDVISESEKNTEVVDEDAQEEELNYEDLTVKELKELLKEKDIEFNSKANKAELVELLNA